MEKFNATLKKFIFLNIGINFIFKQNSASIFLITESRKLTIIYKDNYKEAADEYANVTDFFNTSLNDKLAF